MPKSTKAVLRKRLHDIETLILSGAAFADIRKFADHQGWGVGERQLRHYMTKVEQEFERASVSKRKQSLGRHLRQRRHLIARAMKAGDLRTALDASRDEAKLEGLYLTSLVPGAKGGPPFQSALSCDERLRRYINAGHRRDKGEQRLMESISPVSSSGLSDLMFAELMLHIVTMNYVIQQLDHAATVLSARLGILSSPNPREELGLIWGIFGYLFKVHEDGWKMFVKCRGIDGDRLVRDNYLGDFLMIHRQLVYEAAPTEEDLVAELKALKIDPPKLVTAYEISLQYYNMMEPSLADHQ